MISAADFVCLPYTPDLTEAGISYACRSLPHTYDHMGGSSFDRLRRIVVGIAVELAFRRFLLQQDVPFDVKGATAFTEPDRYDVALGGHRCDIKSFLISYREQIRSLSVAPEQLLKAPALVPLDQHAGEEHAPGDVYLFAFLTGLVAAAPDDVRKAAQADRPMYWMHAMPPAWVRPRTWTPLGSLVLKSESDEPLSIELGGQDGAREFITYALELPPHQRVEIKVGFHSLAYVHAGKRPSARLGLYSPARRETYLVAPVGWGNIWVYGMKIFLTGWITKDEFRQRASLLREGSRVFQYDRTRTKNLAVPVVDLRPLEKLLSLGRAQAGPPSNASSAASFDNLA